MCFACHIGQSGTWTDLYNYGLSPYVLVAAIKKVTANVIHSRSCEWTNVAACETSATCMLKTEPGDAEARGSAAELTVQNATIRQVLHSR